MNVLLLSQFYWPEERIAPTHLAVLAEELQASGHRVTVLTGFPNHPVGQIYDGYRMKLWQWEDVRGVKVLRLPLFPDHSLSAVRRAANYTSFALSAATLGSFLTRKERPDVLFSYLPPLALALPVSIMRRFHDIPVVYWMTDIWPEGLLAAGVTMTSLTYRFLRTLETLVYRQATNILVNSPGFKEHLIERGVPAPKLEVLVDWAEEGLFFPAQADERLARECSMDGMFNVVYAGNLGTAQHLETVIGAAELLRESKDIQFVFIGDGTDKSNLVRKVNERNLGNVIFVGRQPLDEIHRFLALADVLLIHLRDDPTYRMQIPSKTIAYLATGKPILCAVSGSAADLVAGAGAGVTCPPEDPQAMATKIQLIYGKSRAERMAMGQRGRATFLSNYTRELQVARVKAILRQASNNHRSHGVPFSDGNVHGS